MRLVATRSCFAAILTSQLSLTKSARSQVSASHQHTEHWAGFSPPLKSEPHPSPHESTHPSRRLAAPMAAASLKLSSSASPRPRAGSHLLPPRAPRARSPRLRRRPASPCNTPPRGPPMPPPAPPPSTRCAPQCLVASPPLRPHPVRGSSQPFVCLFLFVCGGGGGDVRCWRR